MSPISSSTRRLAFPALILAVTLGFIALWFSRSPVRKANSQKVVIAVPWFQSSALIFLADQLEYFEAEGLDVRLELRATGRECLDLALAGKADFAVVFETPVVHALLSGQDVKILTELHRSEKNTAIVARKKSGIASARDLVGKRVGVSPKTNAEFLLDLFLRSHLVDSSKIVPVHFPIGESVEELRAGRVDAAALWEPYVGQAIADAPDDFVLMKSSYYSEFSLLAAPQKSLLGREPLQDAMILALKRAADFYYADRKAAREIVDEFLRKQNAFVSTAIWQNFDVHLGLSSTLLTMLTEETRWYSAKAGPATDLTELKAVLDDRALSKFAPDLVTFR